MMTDKNRKTTVLIDRTLPEIISTANMSRLDILNFCWLLEQAGVNLIEINTSVLSKLGKLPEGLDFILEVEKKEDLEIFITAKIKRCVLKPAILKMHTALEELTRKGLFTILEINTDSLQDLSWLDETGGDPGWASISSIRLSGLEKELSPFWLEQAENIRTLTSKSLDICPEYSMSMGNAIIQEAADYGMDYVTSTFSGYGRERSFASTEILLTALKVLYKDPRKSNLEILPKLKELFEGVSHHKITGNSPVIGRNIFVIESGIHAAGINSEPNTYEPYAPDIVGQKRELVIGKHSGKVSIAMKMNELGMEIDRAELQQLLKRVRKLSVKLNRGLSEQEFINVCTHNVMH